MPDRADRASYFPAIEKRYGQPMAYWFERMKELAGRGYPEQMAALQAQHGFSRAHANALVLYARGSASARRVDSIDAYLAPVDAVTAATARAILGEITAAHPELEAVIAWNKPMLKRRDRYVFGLSVTKRHLLIAPMVPGVLDAFLPRLAGYEVNKKTVRVPADWTVDAALLRDLIDASLAALDARHPA